MGPGRVPNGSTLKQEITPPANFDDPLKVLSRVVGSPLHEEDDSVNDGIVVENPPDLIEDIEFDGRSLHKFVDSTPEPKEECSATDYCGHGFSVEECE